VTGKQDPHVVATTWSLWEVVQYAIALEVRGVLEDV